MQNTQCSGFWPAGGGDGGGDGAAAVAASGAEDTNLLCSIDPSAPYSRLAAWGVATCELVCFGLRNKYIWNRAFHTSNTTMNSLEWRAKKLEQTIVGPAAVLSHIEQFRHHQTILSQLDAIAQHYASSLNDAHQIYPKYVQLYQKHKSLVNETDSLEAKKAIVLAYEAELQEYMQDLNTMADKADKVLRIEAWPDMSLYKERVDKLQQITRDQHIESNLIDKRTGELIEIYNDIISSFKKNISTWDQKLNAQMEDKNDEN